MTSLLPLLLLLAPPSRSLYICPSFPLCYQQHHSGLWSSQPAVGTREALLLLQNHLGRSSQPIGEQSFQPIGGRSSQPMKGPEGMEAGIFHFQKSINLEPYLRELGVGFILRQLAQIGRPSVAITKDCPSGSRSLDDRLEGRRLDGRQCRWMEHIDAGVPLNLMQTTVNFRLDQPVAFTTIDGRKVTTTFRKNALNHLVEEQVGPNHTTTLTRTFTREGMVVNLHLNNVTASIFFRRKN